MRRCFDLARLGHLSNGTNPCVGSLLLSGIKIKSEGYYRTFGGPHAESDCLSRLQDQKIDADDELFVSLEPCNIHGKTPPCRDLIISRDIKNVCVSVTDPNPQISGSSLEQLAKQGVKCHSGLLGDQGQQFLRSFRTSITRKRPYLILKWAQSRDGFIGQSDERIKISGGLVDRLVHKWRAASDGILVGTETALVDNPRLDNRLFYGPSPTRIILDRDGRIPLTHHVLNDKTPTIILGRKRSDSDFIQTSFIPYDERTQLPHILKNLYQLGLGSILIEGGRQVLEHFLKNGLWDECRVIISDKYLKNGIPAPKVDLPYASSLQFGNDQVLNFMNKAPNH